MTKSQCASVEHATDIVVEYMNGERLDGSIARVIKHFNGWESYIEHSCHNDSEFRSLCEDYAVCDRALENWQASDAVVALQRRKEYAEWLADLEREIQNWLEQRYVPGQSDK
jgi:hypothetical protein